MKLIRGVLQFNLRTRLLVVTAVALFLGRWLHNGRAQQSAVTALKQFGGRVWYAEDVPFWLERRLGQERCCSVIAVDLTNSRITDADLELLRSLPNLRVLTLTNTAISDAGLVHLQRLQRLQKLDLENTEVTAAALDPLSRLQYLCQLNLRGTDVALPAVERLKANQPRLNVTCDLPVSLHTWSTLGNAPPSSAPSNMRRN